MSREERRLIAFSYTITNIGGDFGCKLGKLLRLSPQLREKREKRKVAVSASPTNFSSGFAAASRVSFGNALLIAVSGDSLVTG